MAYLIAGPLVALVGIVAVFFVLRRKSVEKRSMYSARRSQIEHKVRAARQRTLAPGRHSDHQATQTAAATMSPFAETQVQQTVTYDAPAYQAPPMAPPPPTRVEPAPSSAPPPWETPSSPAQAPSFDYPPAHAAPAEPEWSPPAPEPFRPAPEPTPMAPSQPVWTPAPAPATEPVAPFEPAASSASGTAAGSWSVVSTEKDSSGAAESDGKKKKGGDTSSWQLASGEAPTDGSDDPEVKRPAGNLMAIVQYAVLVVGLVMVLIGVLVIIANSHVT
jgi:hypothetical protein